MNDASLFILDGLVLNTSLLVDNGSIYFGGQNAPAASSLTGTGTVLLMGGLYNNSNESGAAGTLTIGAGITIHGTTGIIGDGAIGDGSIVNQGTIDVDSSGEVVSVGYDGSMINDGTLEVANGGLLRLGGSWNNSGTISVAAGATLYLGGTFSQADVGTFNNLGATVYLTGTLMGNLSLTPVLGSWILDGGIIDGVVTTEGGTQLNAISGTLNDVTLAEDSTLAVQGYLIVIGGLTLDGTALLGGSGQAGQLSFEGTQSLGGTGKAISLYDAGGPFKSGLVEGFIGTASGIFVFDANSSTQATLNIGKGISITGNDLEVGSGLFYNYDEYGDLTANLYGSQDASVVNQGSISVSASGETILFGGDAVTNDGTIMAVNGASLNLVSGFGAVSGVGSGTMAVTGNTTGDTTNSGFNPLETFLLDGYGTSSSPQLLEAMSADLLNTQAGYTNNFVYGALEVGSGDYVQLVDQTHNSTSSGNEAVYAVSVSVSAGSTLDLNGLHLYAGSTNIQGTVLNGFISLSAIPPAAAAVSGNGQSIADHASVTSPDDGTSFGSVPQNTGPVDQTFEIINNGIATLNVGNVTLPTGFTVLTPPPASITAKSSADFVIQMNTATAGTFSGNVSIVTSDQKNDPFSFQISGVVTPSEPAAGVSFNGQPIANGSMTPSSANGTDFGTSVIGGAPVVRSFTLLNSGNAALSIGSVNLPTGFSLLGTAASVPAGGSTTFTIGLATGSLGTFSGAVSFSTNDPDNDPFTFAITGTVADEPSLPVGVTASPGTVYTFDTTTDTLSLTSGTLTFTQDVGSSSSLTLNVSADGPNSDIVFDTTQHLNSLALTNGARAQLALSGTDTISGTGSSATLTDYGTTLSQANTKVLVLNSLNIPAVGAALPGGGTNSAQGTLDLTNNSMVLNYASGQGAAALAAADALAQSGSDDGVWDGTGITSSNAQQDANNNGYTGIGIADNSDLSDTVFAGETNLSGNQILFKYTWNGDLDLDGSVNNPDLLQFEAGLPENPGGPAGTGWEYGQLDYGATPQASNADFLLFENGLAGYKAYGAIN